MSGFDINGAVQGFCAWAQQAEQDGHFRGKYKAKELTDLFQKSIKEDPSGASFERSIQKMVSWRGLTKGNVTWAVRKANQMAATIGKGAREVYGGANYTVDIDRALGEFGAWANRAEKDGHFPKCNAVSLTKEFEKCLRHPQFAAVFHEKLRELVSQGVITGGNLKFALAKAQDIYRDCFQVTGQRAPEPSRSAPEPSRSAPGSNIVPEPAPQPGRLPIDIASLQKRAQTGGVSFYDHNDPVTYIFSNYYPYTPVVFHGERYANSEIAFQAQKYTDPKIRKDFQPLTNSDKAKQWTKSDGRYGRQVRSDWRQRNVQAMRDVLAAKFVPGTQAAQALLATGSARLVEHIPVKGRDAFWGDDNDGSGQNMLGQLLMERRQQLGGGN